MKLDLNTLNWVLGLIRSIEKSDYYDYCNAIEDLRESIEATIKEIM